MQIEIEEEETPSTPASSGAVSKGEEHAPLEEPIDFEADAKPKALTNQDLTNISTLAKRLLHHLAAMAFYEEKLKVHAEERNKLEAGEIPELMQSLGLKEFTTTSGAKIEVKEIVSGTITGPKREKAIAWLKEHGHSGIIKHEFKVDLPKSALKDVAKATALKVRLEKLGMGVTDQETVHPQTLCAWAREMLADPETADIPLDTLGIYVGKRATVKQPATTSK